MKRTRWWWALAALSGVALSALVATQNTQWLRPLIALSFPRVQGVNADEVALWQQREPHERPTILDVRTDAEYRVSHLLGAQHVDPDKPDLESVTVRPNAEVVVYCSVGYRSAAIVEQLERSGLRHVYNLEGGIFAWANQERPLYRDDAPTHIVHPYNRLWGYLLRADLRAPVPGYP